MWSEGENSYSFHLAVAHVHRASQCLLTRVTILGVSKFMMKGKTRLNDRIDAGQAVVR